MTNHERRLRDLEVIWSRPAGSLSPAQAAHLRQAVDWVSAERGLDPDEVMDEARRLIAERGWPAEAAGGLSEWSGRGW